MKYIFNRSCSISSFVREGYWLNADIHINIIGERVRCMSWRALFCLSLFDMLADKAQDFFLLVGMKPRDICIALEPSHLFARIDA